MKFDLEIETVQAGRSYRARVETPGFSLALTRPSVDEAVARIGQVLADVLPILESTESDSLGLTEAKPEPVERFVAIDGDSENMRSLLKSAIIADGTVLLDYTDAKQNQTERKVTPVEIEWGGKGDSPERVLKAYDNGILKTFYLSRINRAEAL